MAPLKSPPPILLIVSTAVVIGATFLLLRGCAPPTEGTTLTRRSAADQPTTSHPTAPTPETIANNVDTPPPAPDAPAPPPAPKIPRPLVVQGVYNPPPLEGPHAAELTRIDDLAVTYDAREVPALAAFLNHESAEVRAAAIDGLVRLGAKEAAEPLRAAAAKTKDPREAVALLDAAAYLELPPMPASMRSKLKAAKTTAAPSPAPSEPKKTTAVNGG
jgi:hypothetical protein